MAETVKQILDSMPQHFNPDAAAGLDAIFQFDISGEEAGQWHLVREGSTMPNRGREPRSSQCYLQYGEQ